MKMPRDKSIRYRECREEDLPAIRQLWRDDAQWGDITPEMWRQWYVDIPHGPALIMVGEQSDGKIIAQAAMTPYELAVGDTTHRVVHLAAPIVSRSMQNVFTPNVNHPVIRLLLACDKLARRRGIAAIFAMPRRAWLSLLKLAPMVGVPRLPGATYRCFEIDLTGDPPAPPERVITQTIDHFGDAYDELWDAARRALPIECGIVRDPAYLNFHNGGHVCIEVRDRSGGQLVGYTAVRQDGQIVDMLPRDPSWIAEILAGTRRHLMCHVDASRTTRMQTLRVMQQPLFTDALRALRFRQNRFRFAFTCRVIDESLVDRIHPRFWYLTPGG